MTPISPLSRKFAQNRNGSILIIFALALPVLLLVIGAAVDFFMLERIRSQLQGVADRAALTGAKQFAVAGIKDEQIRATAIAVAAEGVESANGSHDVETEINRKDVSVTVVLSQKWTPFFAHFLDSGITPVRAEAAAAFLGTSNICVLALDPKALSGIHLNIIARMEANNCGVYSNSRSLASIRLDLAGKMTAQSICAVGGVIALLSNISPKPVTDCPPLADPLASRMAPPVGDCDFNDTQVKDGTVTLTSGVYCGGLQVSGSAQVTLEPGVYVIKDGPLKISGQSRFEGSDVGFYLTGAKAVLNLAGSATIRLSGPESGSMAGILLFEDRTSDTNRLHVIRSTRAEELTGTIYLPRGRLYIDPNATVAAESAYTAIIANRIDLTDGPVLALNADYGATQVPVPDGIRATSRVLLIE